MLFLIFAVLLAVAFADCGPQNYVNDPTPWGGAPCTKILTVEE